MPVKTRSDAQRSRILLIDAVRNLLRAGRIGFSMPELAAEAGVGVATAYRHFPTPHEAMQAFHRRAIEQLLEAFAEVDATAAPDLDPVERFHRCCRTWVDQAMEWGPAVRYIRSSSGFIERLASGDEAITAMHDILAEVLKALARQGKTSEFDVTYAVLLWITIFDERVVYDLAEHRGWSPAEITDHLTRAVAGALGITV
ncbi:TetR family transcriptional regulator [Nocardia sp. SYP-A9097]|uniref:TetR/AcrR family transcriptional regulator n=1 Tax=Nocardia sp. SYP-A9097 TaxID=2663237 RepID=UPI00129B8A4D|nr:TetR/AcrR family transcriptional regulator [Nocardia sp. SYP-A9097]MRH92104.1 TetR family transcriptional regulator [Nocardia sp. SYP-A9097]